MATVVFVGGYGVSGSATAGLLVGRDDVERVVIAGRDQAKADAAAERLGPKAVGRRVDVDDPAWLREGIAGATVVVSTLWEPARRQDPVIRAAAEAGAHYADLSGRRPAAEVDAVARAAGITAVTGAGAAPGTTNLMGRAAVAELDEVEGLLGVMHWPGLMDAWADLFDNYVKLPGGLRRGPQGRRLLGTLTASRRDPAEVLAVVRDALVVPFWLQLLADPSSWVERVPVADASGIHHVHPRDGVEVPALGGGTTRVRPLLTEPGGADLPWLEGVPVQSANLSGFAPRFDEALLAGAERVRGGADPAAVTSQVLEVLAHDLDACLLPAEQVAAMYGFIAIAVGRVGGAVARSAVGMAPHGFHPDNFVRLTAVPLAHAVGGLLDGTIDQPGTHRLEEVVELGEALERPYQERLPVVLSRAPLFQRRIERV